MTEVAEPLKKIPGFSQGVRPGSSLRRIILNSPICPYSQIEYIRDAQGRRVPKERAGDEQNCQLAGGKWWIDCEDRGHDPYFTSKVSYQVEDVYETDARGREIKVGEQRIAKREKYPNLVSVPLNRRINNGKGVMDSMEKKGRRRLKDAGYAEVCQYRNCQNAINPKWMSVPFGNYCSKDHFQRSIANEKGIPLPVLNSKLNAGNEDRFKMLLDEQLTKAAWNANDG